MTNNPFSGFFAEFYDILHAGLEDVGAYLEFASKYGPRVLELGSGTGRVLIPLACAGFTVTGIDSSKDMMAVCRERLGYETVEVQRRVTLIEADARGLDLGERFDLIIAPCNFINYFSTPGDAERFLLWTAAHLSPSGTFLLDNGVPDLAHMRAVSGEAREFEFEHPITGTRIIYRVRSRYDFANQLEHSRMELEERGGAGELLRTENAEETLSYYFPDQMRALLDLTGFRITREQGSLLEDTPISDDGGEMVFLCKRRDA